MNRTSTATALAATLAIFLTACGSDASDTAASASETSSTAASGADSSASETPTTNTASETTVMVESVRLWVKPDLVDCEGVGPQTCMQIAESEEGEYEYFYDQIDGFTFAEGTSYVIDVVIEQVDDPPADGSSLRYLLVKIVEQHASD